MFIKRFFILFIIMGAISPCLNACSLPAEPSAAIVPINSAANGMKLVTVGNKFYYLVPQGTSASFKVVWDPAAHNTGGGLLGDKYDWCTKANIPFEPGTDKPNGYGYFPIQKMAEFFQVSGNNSSIQEAFAKETGMGTGDTFIPSITGPFDILSGFVKAGQQGKVTNTGGTSSEYPDTGLAALVSMTDTPVNAAINPKFPNTAWMVHQVPVTSTVPPTMKTVYKVSADRAVVISAEGLLIEGMDMCITTLDPTDYKAFIRTGNAAADIEVESSPQIQWLADGSTGTPGPNFELTFNTPSFNGNLDASKIKLEVWSPGAGFEISNLFWAWKEAVYKKTSVRVVTQAEVKNASGVVIIPEEAEFREVWAPDGNKMCSEEIMVKLVKPAGAAGTTDFIVYDDKAPIAANFQITSTDKTFKATGPSTFDFTLRMLDTNPFFDQMFSTNIAGVNLTQSLANLDLQVYYTYPVYEYSAETSGSIVDLKNKETGIADLDNVTGQPSFKSFRHESKWTWKKADVANLAIGASNPLTGSTGRKAGSFTDITGKLTIQQPRPWHECNDGSGKSSPEPIFKVFAISKDTFGLAKPIHDSIKATVGTSFLTTNADPTAGSADMAYNPADGAVIPPGDFPDQVTGGGVDKTRWSNLDFVKAKDEAGPEIQVIVFDTRTNRCHVFGTKKDVAAGFSAFGANGLVQDYSTGTVPYLGKEAQITAAHRFTDLSDINTLFDRYLQGPNAVSTVDDDTLKGFVCQQNNRLIFYIRAVDNINGYRTDKQYGIQSLSYKLTDKSGVVKDEAISPSAMLDPIEYIFRFENVDAGGTVAPEYSLVVNATDHSNNPREFKLAIAVMGRKLDIRTLEERRQRID